MLRRLKGRREEDVPPHALRYCKAPCFASSAALSGIGIGDGDRKWSCELFESGDGVRRDG